MRGDAPHPHPAPSGAPASHPGAARGRALARAGLLGNPSDGYGGKVLAFTLAELGATVDCVPAERARVEVAGGAPLEGDDLHALAAERAARGLSPDGNALLLAAWGRLAGAAAAAGRPFPREAARLALRAETGVPRQAGLAGSSALVVATLRACGAALGFTPPPHELAELALAAEVEDLGIAAGPQDRVVQAYEGLLYMDFSRPRGPAAYTALEPALLPPTFVAWTPAAGTPSGRPHADVRARWERGDPEIHAAMETFARLAEEGLQAVVAGDRAALARLLDASFDTRASIWPLTAEDRRLVAIAREHGAAAKLAGSGGAVVGCFPDEDPGGARTRALARACRDAGLRFLVPTVGVSTEAGSVAEGGAAPA